jgi:exopolysaccharide biosynthesis polyprenyl glycosylphosphotransferase
MKMSPHNELYAIEAQAPTAAGWRFGRQGFADALPAVVDHLVLLTVLYISRVMLGAFNASVTAFVLTVLVLQVWPEFTSRRLRPSAVDDTPLILRRALMAFGGVAALSVLTGSGPLEPVLTAGLAATPALVLGRAGSYATARKVRAHSRRRTVIVGGGEIARRIISALEERSEYGMEVVGAVDDYPKLEASELGTRVLGGIADLPRIARSHRVENVVVAFSQAREAETMSAIRTAVASGVHVWIVPRLFELGGTGRNSDHLWGYPLVKVAAPAPSRPQWALKRALDVAVAGLGVIVAAPFLALIAVGIRLESAGPVLFKQRRVGSKGKPFDIYKFRTMKVCDATVNDTEWTADEDRITRVGRFLRDTGLDEVPQLFNVMRGHMSLVGPRPERPFFVDQFSQEFGNYDARHRLPVGVTGWAQIHGLRGDTSIEDRVALDNYYIDNWSLGQDVKIILKTVPTFFTKQEEE